MAEAVIRKRLEARLVKIQNHVGHRVQFYSRGHKDNYAKIARAAIRPDIQAVCIWLEKESTDTFPRIIFDDQLWKCDCQRQA